MAKKNRYEGRILMNEALTRELLANKEGIKKYNEAVNKLRAVCSELDPEGVLYIAMLSEKAKHQIPAKLMRVAIDMPKMYSYRKTQENPFLGEDLVAINGWAKDIIFRVNKRRKALSSNDSNI